MNDALSILIDNQSFFVQFLAISNNWKVKGLNFEISKLKTSKIWVFEISNFIIWWLNGHKFEFYHYHSLF
jgi:hypothetical protein